MNENLKNLIEEYVSALPKEIQEIVTAFDWASISSQIGKENYLSDEQINDLQVETALVLVGLTKVEYFTKNIEDKVGISDADAKKIAVETLNKIFKVVSEKTAELIRNRKSGSELSWNQNVKFILSGGDYLSLLEIPNRNTGTTETKAPPSPKNVTDLRDKFTI